LSAEKISRRYIRQRLLGVPYNKLYHLSIIFGTPYSKTYGIYWYILLSVNKRGRRKNRRRAGCAVKPASRFLFFYFVPRFRFPLFISVNAVALKPAAAAVARNRQFVL
jgi:hypothetical protein